MWDFVKRHRGKIALVGGLVAGSGLYYALDKYIFGRFQLNLPYEQRPIGTQEKHVLQERKAYIFQCHQKTCEASCLQLFGILVQKIDARFPVEKLLDTLKASEENGPKKVELWAELKNAALCRLTCLTYGSAILILTLKIQINLVASEIFVAYAGNFGPKRAAQNGVSDPQKPGTSSESHFLASENGDKGHEAEHVFLQSFQYFMQSGLSQLMDLCEAMICRESVDIREKFALKSAFKFADFTEFFDQNCLKAFEKAIGRHLSDFVVPCLDPDMFSALATSVHLEHLLMELKAWLETGATRAVLRYIVDEFSHGLNDFCQKSEKIRAWVSMDPGEHELLPVAKIVPVLANGYKALTDVQSVECPLNEIFDSVKLTDFAKCVYESACLDASVE